MALQELFQEEIMWNEKHKCDVANAILEQGGMTAHIKDLLEPFLNMVSVLSD